jgi:hypothetical protein
MKAEATEKQTIWEERVRGWQASGMSAKKYAETNGFSESTLRYWSYRLVGTSRALRILRLVPKAACPAAPPETSPVAEALPALETSPRFEASPEAETSPAKVASPLATTSQLMVEVGLARIVVQSGFDRQLLAEVVGALSGGAR